MEDTKNTENLVVQLADETHYTRIFTIYHKAFSPDAQQDPATIEGVRRGFLEALETPWGSEGRTRFWILVRNGEAVSVALTTRRAAFVKRPNQAVFEDLFYTVGPIATAREYLKRGYAHLLLETLHYVLSDFSPPFPTKFGIDLSKLRQPPAIGSQLTTLLRRGWYETITLSIKVVDADGTDKVLEQPGWVSTDNEMNSDVYWKIPAEGERLGGTDPSYKCTILYEEDFPELSKVLSKRYRDELNERTDDATLVAPDPGANGWLYHFEYWTWLTSRMERDREVPFRIRGMRFTREGTDGTKDPIVLLHPCAYPSAPHILPVTCMSYITPEVLPTVLQKLAEQGRSFGATRVRAWGLREDDQMTSEWMKLGASFESRNETRKAPYGWCSYGPPGEMVKFVKCELLSYK